MTSQDEIARERAAPMQQGCVSSNTPLPIGVSRKGNCVYSMNLLTSELALASTQPLPDTEDNTTGITWIRLTYRLSLEDYDLQRSRCTRPVLERAERKIEEEEDRGEGGLGLVTARS